jgi:hypothetical protein
MGLRKLSAGEEKIQTEVINLREKIMAEMGVREVSRLTVDQIEQIAERVMNEIPEYKELSRKDLGAFKIQKGIEGDRRLN